MRKIAKYIAIGLLVLVGVIFHYSYTAYPPEYVNRVLRLSDDTTSTTIPSIIVDAKATEFVGMYLRSLIRRKEGNTQLQKKIVAQ